MIQKVILPKLGETVEVSTIERWLKREGDAVSPGDVLCEITTDKATLEVESYYRGTVLKILAREGQELAVGSVIAVVGEPGDAVPADLGGAETPAAAPAAKTARAAEPAPATAAAAPAAAPAPVAAAAIESVAGLQQVTLPKLGETVEFSTIERWVKSEGDAVNPGDILCEITTDKATLEVESYHRGMLLKILAPAGQELPVGSLIAVIGAPGTAIPAAWLAGGAQAAFAAPSSPAAEAVTAAAEAVAPLAARTEGGRVFASPRARAKARELGIAVDGLAGSGPGGRIVEADVLAAAKGAPAVRATPLARKVAAKGGVDLARVQGRGPGGRIMREDVLQAADVAAHTPPPAASSDILPLTAMRRIVAQRMLASKQTVPCYYLEIDADVSDLVCLRNKMNLKSQNGKISFNDFVLRACGLALRMFPSVNSEWVEGRGIRRRGRAGAGLAVALDPEGLMVPVVRDPDQKTLWQIAKESADLAQRARAKRLTPDEYQGGSMTVSNLGMFGITRFIPVVNPGESCIMGLGTVRDTVVYRQGGIQVRKMMALTLAVDHRLVDGAVGAQFLEAIRDLLEAPQRLAEE